jgi:hypothetical protein
VHEFSRDLSPSASLPPRSRFPVFPVETGIFADFPFQTPLGCEKNKPNQAVASHSRGVLNGNLQRPNRELNASNRELRELTANIILRNQMQNLTDARR